MFKTWSFGFKIYFGLSLGQILLDVVIADVDVLLIDMIKRNDLLFGKEVFFLIISPSAGLVISPVLLSIRGARM